MNFIYKDYQLNNGWIIKTKLHEGKHLMWSLGGVPAIDSQVWDNYKDKGIKIYTAKGRKFEIDKDTFEANKKLIDYGFGQQYVVDKKHWDITCST